MVRADGLYPNHSKNQYQFWAQIAPKKCFALKPLGTAEKIEFGGGYKKIPPGPLGARGLLLNCINSSK